MKKVISLLVVAALTLSLCSCSVMGIVMGAASAIQQAEANQTPKGGDTDYWKNGIPSTIPEFKYGTYDARLSRKITDKDGTAYLLEYTGVKQQDLDDYAKLLTAAGLDVSTTEGDDDDSVMGTLQDISTFSPSDGPSPQDGSFPPDLISAPFVIVHFTASDGTCSVDVDIPVSSN